MLLDKYIKNDYTKQYFKMIIYTLQLFFFSLIGFIISKMFGGEISVFSVSIGEFVDSELMYNPIFEIIGMIIIIISKKRFDSKYISIKNSLQRKQKEINGS